jgi:xanthine dehydrogenase small subunit
VIEFVLNGRTEKVDQIDPNLSILEWLRTKMRLTGTKEGCASGDCGACTVITGTPGQQGNIRYEAINSCISLIGSLHGKELITVDAFRQEPGHPVQRAMMEQHGAQCGFCTPGIVMSLVALHANKEDTVPDDHRLLAPATVPLLRPAARLWCRSGHRKQNTPLPVLVEPGMAATRPPSTRTASP